MTKNYKKLLDINQSLLNKNAISLDQFYNNKKALELAIRYNKRNWHKHMTKKDFERVYKLSCLA